MSFIKLFFYPATLVWFSFFLSSRLMFMPTAWCWNERFYRF